MTLEFSREVIIVSGLPLLGTITVEVELEDGLLYPYCSGFEPETPKAKLWWADVENPCENWLAQNKARVEREALKPRE